LDAAKPDNLKRQLRFYNYAMNNYLPSDVTNNYDVWFSPGAYKLDTGLGFSFGILRGTRGVSGARAARGCRCRAGAGAAASVVGVDAVALATIDEVRSNDRKQSLLNLGQPLTLRASQSHAP